MTENREMDLNDSAAESTEVVGWKMPMDRVMKICRTYSDSKIKAQQYKGRIASMEKLVSEAVDPFEKNLYSKRCADLKRSLKKDVEVAALYDIAFDSLNDEEQLVIRQLFEEGCKWSKVKDEFGQIMPHARIQRVRNRALESMRKTMEEEMSAYSGPISN